MKDKADKIDWDKVEREAEAAYRGQPLVIDWLDFREGFMAGYGFAFEEWR